MNQEEKKYVIFGEQTINRFEQEVKVKDALIQEQTKVIQAQKRHIYELSGLLNKIFKQ